MFFMRLIGEKDTQRKAYLKKNVYFWKDEEGRPLWKDTYIYARLNENA